MTPFEPYIVDDNDIPDDIMQQAEENFHQKDKSEAELLNPQAWDLDLNDPKLFEADETFEPLDFKSIEDAQKEALANIVDEETLKKTVDEWFNRDIKFSTPIVSGLLFRSSIAAIYGPSHAGKTLLASAISSCLSRGVPFGDLGVRKTPIIYLNAESSTDFNKRYMAELEDAGVEDMPNFRVRHGAFDVRDPIEREKLIRILPKIFGSQHYPPLFIFDTLPQHLSGVEGEPIDENSAKDMGQYIYGLRDISERTGGTILLITHSGKDATKGIRGSSAIRGALDTEIMVESDTDGKNKLVKMTITKQRFCSAIDPCCYRIKSVILKTIKTAAEQQLDEDDVMIMPDRNESQFTRVIAPSNQSAVIDHEPLPIQEDEEEEKVYNPKDVPVAKYKTSEPSDDAKRMCDVINSYFNGKSDRISILNVWKSEGGTVRTFDSAIDAGERHGILTKLPGGVIKTSIQPSIQGALGSSADIKEKNESDAEF